MSVIVAWLSTFIGSAITSLTAYFGKKYAFAAVYVAAWVSFAAIFAGVVNGLLSSISWAIPAVSGPLAMLPWNIGTCTGMIISAHIAAAVYQAQVNLLSLKSRV